LISACCSNIILRMKEDMPRAKERRIDIGRKIVSFIGPEGSGKTTIAKLLASASNKPYIATGDLIRDLATNDQSRYGDACRAMFSEHKYLDPNMMLEILQKRIRQSDTKEGFILDGVLRRVEEVKGFQAMLEKADRIFPLIIVHLRIPGWMSFERLLTGDKARRREDDTIEAIFGRLSNYYNQLNQRSTFIANQENWKFLYIKATGSPEEVFENLCEKLTI